MNEQEDDEDDDFFNDLDQEELAELDDLDRSYAAATQPKSVDIKGITNNNNNSNALDLESRLKIKTDELQRAVGEIHVVRGKLDQLRRQRDQETTRLCGELETQTERYRNQLQQLQKTVDRMNTESSFMKRELQDVTQRYSLLANKRLGTNITRSPSPHTSRNGGGSMVDFEASLKDGFDPRLSPSRKRKRGGVELPTAAAATATVASSTLEYGHRNEETHFFISQLLNLCDSETGHKLVEGDSDLAGCIFEAIGNVNQLDSKSALVKDIITRICGLWSTKCSQEKDNNDTVVEILMFIFEIDDTNVCKNIQILDQILQTSVDKINSAGSKKIFTLLEYIAINCCIEESLLGRFCNRVDYQLLIDLVNSSKSSDIIISGVRIISVCIDYWFATATSAAAAAATGKAKEGIIDALAKLTNQSFNKEQQQGKEWSLVIIQVLSVYKAIALRPGGTKLLVEHALVNLIACLDQYIQLLRYMTSSNVATRQEFIEIVRQSVSLIHGINILHPTQVGKFLPTKSTYTCLVTMAAVGFGENDQDDEIVDCAREMLELNLTMEEADRMHEAINVQ